MKWEDHKRWARKFGISGEIADYVNKIIDISGTERLPDEYTESVQNAAETIAIERGATQGNSALAHVIVRDLMGHDSGRRQPTRGDIAAECTLRHLRQKGNDFVDAWYLHHHLDYLHEQRATSDNLGDSIRRYRNEYSETHSQEVEKFLVEHADSLAGELGYHTQYSTQ